MTKPRELTPEELEYLRENYPTTLNRDIVEHLQTSYRTLSRWVRLYGLKKDMDAIEGKRRKLISDLSRKALLLRNYKGHPENGIKSQFKPGYNARERFGEEKFKEMHRKTVETRRKTYREERARAAFGLPQKTKMRVKRQPRPKIDQRHYLKRHGYIIDNTESIAYYTDETIRCHKLESKPRNYFKFKPYAEHQREHQDQ